MDNIEKEYLNRSKEYDLYVSPNKELKFITNTSKYINKNLKKTLNKEIDRNYSIYTLNQYTYNLDISYQLEAGVYEFALIYTTIKNIEETLISAIYKDKLNDIIYNLKDLTSAIQNWLKDENFNFQKIAFLPPQELNPSVWQELIRRQTLREYKKNNIATTDLYKCYKCGERRCQAVQMQTRSADEPMTTFITCLVCFNTFKK